MLRLSHLRGTLSYQSKQNLNSFVTKSTTRYFSNGPNKITGSSSPLSRMASLVVDNIRQAWNEMTGKNKETVLKKTVFQAQVYKPPKNEDGDEEEPEKYDGPTTLVHVKEPLSAWENMKNRLKDSPLIQNILKNSAKVTKVVADTSVGKKATEINQSIKDKIEDAREIWETSQNPIIYSIGK